MLVLLLAIICFITVLSSNETITKEDQRKFDALVKAVKQAGGYVHPSIGLVAPAPSGAPRGIGMVKKVQPPLTPGSDLLIRVPYSYQLSRPLAMDTLNEVLSHEQYSLLVDLDDAALLVLLLAHEYGLGKKSKFHTYIQSLPSEGGCGYDYVKDLRDLPPGVEQDDIEMAIMYAHRVSNGMAQDFAASLAQSNWPKEWKQDPSLALRWGLCMVSSRGTAANASPGNSSASGVRLIPLADMANHRRVSGGYMELSGEEGDASLAGSFVIKSTWKCGTTHQLEKGEEITVNYNLPNYQVVDWFLSLGFVPREAYVKDEDEDYSKKSQASEL